MREEREGERGDQSKIKESGKERQGKSQAKAKQRDREKESEQPSGQRRSEQSRSSQAPNRSEDPIHCCSAFSGPCIIVTASATGAENRLPSPCAAVACAPCVNGVRQRRIVRRLFTGVSLFGECASPNDESLSLQRLHARVAHGRQRRQFDAAHDERLRGAECADEQR